MQGSERIRGVDLLRGLAMIFMALGHTRTYMGMVEVDPDNLSDPAFALFLMRWLTNFCAPVFVFLAGTSAWLAGSRHGDNAQLRRLLLTRGCWLIAIEFLVINPLWMQWQSNELFVQVLWALGISMVLLGLCIPLGVRAIAAIGLVIVFGHDLLNGIPSNALGTAAPLWMVLHEYGRFSLAGDWVLKVYYPVLPWIGVMFLGYAAGSIMTSRRDWTVLAAWCGVFAIALFLVLRTGGFYGDPGDFVVADTLRQSVVSFLKVAKYPPSLQYLLMTLGAAVLLLIPLEKWRGTLSGVVAAYGRCALFFYVLHFVIIYLVVSAWAFLQYGEIGWVFLAAELPSDYRGGPIQTILAWLIVVVLSYFPCRWFATFKQANRGKWWARFV